MPEHKLVEITRSIYAFDWKTHIALVIIESCGEIREINEWCVRLEKVFNKSKQFEVIKLKGFNAFGYEGIAVVIVYDEELPVVLVRKVKNEEDDFDAYVIDAIFRKNNELTHERKYARNEDEAETKANELLANITSN